jgi:murein DD-endopeptidase MepM/ murein hydrolase activator NlpD
MQTRARKWLFILLISLVTGCAASHNPGSATIPAGIEQRLPSQPALPSPSATAHPEATIPPTQTAIHSSPTPGLTVCSPLEGISLDKIPEAIVNPYHPPPLGSDNPHQGIDLAQRRPGDQVALAGLPVHAVLPGRVASVLQDRFPFGNAVLVETRLDSMPDAWVNQLDLPSAQVTPTVRSALTCPPTSIPPAWETGARSLYILYAHMATAPALMQGDEVTCGQSLGNIGSSGNALNPHLHLEIRVGPAGARFASMAHYATSAKPEEMANYCVWSVSGLFQSIDPMRVLELQR